jgi:O-acetyl-ADP-ribose deacetylase (regulator of RNase III)
LEILEKNILDVKEGVICHQVNCQRVMGSGLARQIRNKWPIVYEEYKKNYELRLGNCQVVQVTDDLFVANLAGQDRYGTDRSYTDYDALEVALIYVDEIASALNKQLYIPYLMGCGLAGGDWKIVSEIIERVAPKAIICKLS